MYEKREGEWEGEREKKERKKKLLLYLIKKLSLTWVILRQKISTDIF